MTIDLTRLTANTQTWAQTASTANVSVPLSDGGPRTLTGMAAAAYLFGQALTTVKYQDTLDGVQLSDCRFQFPPAPAPTSGPDNRQWVSLSEVADALRYKYGVDPLIEFAPGLGARGYSVSDINRILELLNREFADSFKIALTVSRAAVEVATQDVFATEKTQAWGSSAGKVQTNEYIAFPTNPNWVSGTTVRVSASGSIFSANTDYFVRNLDGGNYSFFASRDQALGTETTGLIDLTALIGSGDVTISSKRTLKSNYLRDSNSNYIDDDILRSVFQGDPNWTTGTPVSVRSALYSGLPEGTTYFVRNLGSGNYQLFTSESEALGTGTAGLVDLRASMILDVSLSYVPTDFSTLLNTASTPILAPATETELRQNLTEGGDLYTDRFGAFYLNGVRTQAMDVAVTSRLLVQDNVSAEYKTLMDELAERNNLIAAARTVLSVGSTAALGATVASLAEQYGMVDVLSELTAGEYTDDAFLYRPTSTTVTTPTTNGSIFFSSATNPFWQTGARVRATTTEGGLTAGADYFISNLGGGRYSLYNNTEATYNNTVAPIPLTGPVGRLIIPYYTAVPSETLAGFSVDTATPTYDSSGNMTGGNYVTSYEARSSWFVGTRVRVGLDGGGLFAGRDYFINRYVRSGQDRYEFYDTAQNALNAANGGTSGRITLTGSIGNVSSQGVVTFSTDPGWPIGTRVKASATGGGLIKGTEYFVDRVGNLGSGKYSFSETGGNALNQPSGLVILTGPISAAISNTVSAADFTALTPLLNTLISNKVRDGDLDQAKLQTLTAQLQNNTEAMTALIKAFTDMNAQLARAL